MALRKVGIGALQLTPRVVDSIFGRLPGALADFAAKHGLEMMESRRRLVIYDFESQHKDLLISNLLKMIKAAENVTGEEIDNRASQYNASKGTE